LLLLLPQQLHLLLLLALLPCLLLRWLQHLLLLRHEG
jgi:hypothetical protein